MAESIEKRLTDYLRGEFFRERGKGKGLAKFKLSHAAPGAKGNVVEEFDMAGEDVTPDDVGRIAADILGRAQTDADGMGPGVHRYVLQAFQVGDNRGSTRFALRLRSQDEDNDFDGIGGSDEPTLKGALGQQMRHNEALARILVQVVGTTNNQMSKRMEAMDAEMTAMRTQRTADFAALEASHSEEQQREMMAMEMMQSNARKDKAFEKLLGYAPIIANRLAGKQLLSGGVDPLQEMLGGLVESLKPEQFQAIAATLAPDQQLKFVEILRAFEANKKGNNHVDS